MPYPIILAIGFLAQIFFSARILIQWILSERAKKVTSPSIFWILSIAGSYLLCLYGWLKDDFAIILGQFISYYIYLWNLKIKNIWQNIISPCVYIISHKKGHINIVFFICSFSWIIHTKF